MEGRKGPPPFPAQPNFTTVSGVSNFDFILLSITFSIFSSEKEKTVGSLKLCSVSDSSLDAVTDVTPWDPPAASRSQVITCILQMK